VQRGNGGNRNKKNIVAVIEGLYYFEFSDPNLNQEYVYGVEVSSSEEIVLDRKEHSEYRWCSSKKLGNCCTGRKTKKL